MSFLRTLLTPITFPLSLVYGSIIWIRNKLYDREWFSLSAFDVPIISVGNITTGGTGKTPMTEYLIRMLQGQRVAVLSRGYKRKSEGFLLATPHTGVLDLGDEPYQLKKKFLKMEKDYNLFAKYFDIFHCSNNDHKEW